MNIEVCKRGLAAAAVAVLGVVGCTAAPQAPRTAPPRDHGAAVPTSPSGGEAPSTTDTASAQRTRPAPDASGSDHAGPSGPTESAATADVGPSAAGGHVAGRARTPSVARVALPLVPATRLGVTSTVAPTRATSAWVGHGSSTAATASPAPVGSTAPAPSDAPVVAPGADDQVRFCLTDVSLSNGHFLRLDTLVAELPPVLVKGREANTFPRGSGGCTFAYASLRARSVAAYQINMLDKPSSQWVVISRAANGDLSCKIAEGNPTLSSPGADRLFDCRVHNDAPTYEVEVGLLLGDRLEGDVRTTGLISLIDGYWEAIQPFQINGSPTVGTNSSTHFRTIQRAEEPILAPDENGNKTIKIDDDAVMWSAYRIVDNETPTNYWVRFFATTQGSPGHASCQIFYGNPVPSLGAPSGATRESLSPYVCNANYGSGGAGVYSVGPRAMTVVPGDAAHEVQRSQLMAACVSKPENCSFALGDARRVYGAFVDVASDPFQNNTSQPVEQSITATHTTTITNTIGISWEVSFGVAGIVETKITTTYEYSIATSNEISKTQTMTIAPHKTGWFGMIPMMIHVEGAMLVKVDDTVYLLPGVSADYPDGSGQAVLVAQES